MVKRELRVHSDTLRYLFYPRSVAVIGASRYPGKVGYEILENIIKYGFKGIVYPVNPKATEILGLKCYPSVKDIPDEVDLAVVCVPAPIVPTIVRECGEKGVKVLVIISSGFKEVGNVELERKIVEIASKYGMRILGPNIFGIFCAKSKLNATFGPAEVLPGKIALISQSGALGIALMGWTISERIGLSAVVSVGNKADIDDADLLKFFADDDSTKTIMIYLEGLRRAREFMKVAREVSMKKPIIVIKAGRSERGAKAAVSHTGAMATDDAIYSAAFKQCGVLRALDLESALDWARALSELKAPEGEGVIIITNGGGIGVMATDECIERGLKLVDPPQDLMETMRRHMPPFGSPLNPVDLTGQATEYEYYGALVDALTYPLVHAILVLYCETAIVDPMRVAESIIRARENTRVEKPIIASLVGGVRSLKAIDYLNSNGIPAYPTVSRAVSALDALYEWSRWRAKFKTTVRSPA